LVTDDGAVGQALVSQRDHFGDVDRARLLVGSIFFR